MSKLLLDEQPLLIMPKLATKIGLNESIIVQQIHYWNKINKQNNNNFIDGHYWTYNTYEEWNKQFPFWCEKTIRTIMTKLENKGIVISGNYNKMKIDRTKWYRLNYEIIDNLPLGKTYRMDRKNLPNDKEDITAPIPKTTTEITTKINNDNGITSAEDNTLCMNIKNSRRYFCDRYEREYNKPYYRHKAEQNKIIDSKLKEAFIDNYLELENMEDMIDKYFSSVNCDHNLMHFISDGIIKNRVYEIG